MSNSDKTLTESDKLLFLDCRDCGDCKDCIECDCHCDKECRNCENSCDCKIKRPTPKRPTRKIPEPEVSEK